MEEKLVLKSVAELLGEKFFIPHYQRGYRWTSQQVEDLLNDIDSFVPKNIPGSDDKTFYCLQPIAVKECSDETKDKNKLNGKWYELVDGQQRLTTIYLIIRYANEMWIGKQKKQLFEIKYETREKSSDFLGNLIVNEMTNRVDIDKANIDFYHISLAYDTINTWVANYNDVNGKPFDENDFQSKLNSSAKVIWYEVDANTNSVELFTRLNMGKIPLTNSELVKALFLSSSSFAKESPEEVARRKMEISQLWDEMEVKLNDTDFWAFITNDKAETYPTKIELLFDFIAKKKKNGDPLFTFIYFLKESKNPGITLWDLWIRIEKYFLTLVEWHKNRDYYHKVGFLVYANESIRDLIELSMETEKKYFERELDQRITECVNYDIDSLSYDIPSEKKHLERLLVLFNIESIRTGTNLRDFYPFQYHKSLDWSLEHIHAQNSEPLDRVKKEPWLKWLNYHNDLITELVEEEKDKKRKKELSDLKKEIEEYLNDEGRLTWDLFNALSQRIIKLFTHENDDLSEMHTISNLALLSSPDNSALNNAVFEVKRREIIEMDKAGSYIPICTKRAFLKYYNKQTSSQQLHFWSKDDRKNYLSEIKTVLKDYLPKN